MEQSKFWFSLWVSAGKPLNTTLHTIMKKSRNRYHLVLRKKKRIIEINRETTLKMVEDIIAQLDFISTKFNTGLWPNNMS